jgi:peroxiredoxin
MTLMIFAITLPWLFLGLGFWLGYQLLLQNGRIVLRLEMLEKQIRQLGALLGGEPDSPQGLPVGMAAPEFELPDLAGQPQKLSQFRGRRLLLIFFNPKCGYCEQMAPDLAALESAAWPAQRVGWVESSRPTVKQPSYQLGKPMVGLEDSAHPTNQPELLAEGDRPALVLVCSGSPQDNRRLIEEHGIRCPVLLQKDMEVATQFQAHGTPTGYLIDEAGKIASDLAVGAEALLALTRPPNSPLSPRGRGAGGEGAEQTPNPTANGHVAKPVRGKTNKGLSYSRINRNGLKAGTPAPGFRLPRLEGGELALEEFRGREVLLVFSDPECGPCEELAPHLEEFHRHNPDIEVLMISRGEPEINRKKAKALGLTFPVVLQRQWEVSMLYGMFATPMAYLIDEQGLLATDVAAGVGPIQALMASAGTHGRKPQVFAEPSA